MLKIPLSILPLLKNQSKFRQLPENPYKKMTKLGPRGAFLCQIAPNSAQTEVSTLYCRQSQVWRDPCLRTMQEGLSNCDWHYFLVWCKATNILDDNQSTNELCVFSHQGSVPQFSMPHKNSDFRHRCINRTIRSVMPQPIKPAGNY